MMNQQKRTAKLEELALCLLQAAQAAQELVTDDLDKLARGREAHGHKRLSLVAHRTQLAHGQVLELVNR